MTQADFDFTKLGSVQFVGGDNGEPQYNPKYPLTGHGLFARAFRSASSNALSTEFPSLFAAIKSSVDGGVFVETPDTKKISVRASVMITHTNTITQLACGIMVKSGLYESQRSPYGYSMYVGDEYSSSPGADIKLCIRKSVSLDTSGVHQLHRTFGTIVAGQWTRIRMDVTPIGPSEDLIECYTGVGDIGSEVWTLEWTENVTTMFVPWAESGRGRVGWFARTNANSLYYTSNVCGIDEFTASVEDV